MRPSCRCPVPVLTTDPPVLRSRQCPHRVLSLPTPGQVLLPTLDARHIQTLFELTGLGPDGVDASADVFATLYAQPLPHPTQVIRVTDGDWQVMGVALTLGQLFSWMGHPRETSGIKWYAFHRLATLKCWVVEETFFFEYTYYDISPTGTTH